MGEEEKKPAAEEVKKPEEPKKVEEEEKKKEEKPAEKPAAEEKKDGKKTEETKDKSPPPPQEIVLKVYMHCEGCARKIHRCLRGFEGVEDVTTDCKASKVVVKGEKADPLKVLERVQRKSHKQVVLISPIPKPPSEEEKKAEEKEKPKVEQKKEEPPVIRVVVLRVSMHCEACAMEIKKRILRMKGVESAEPDLKSSEVTVKGVFEPENLVDYVHKRTGKHAVIVKQEPEKKEEEKGKESKEEKKGGGGDKQNKGGDGGAGEQGENKDKKEGGGGDNEAKAEAKAAAAEETTDETTVVELRKMDFYNYYPPTRYEYDAEYAPPPQIFSDENPNACSVM
ncbi:HEAVY METAL-ASSOCIATED ISOPRENYLATED PLANT PROTEIN 7 [Salix viminalis]|uniref:HEAVY METAL-ASSOCIATED ISOPRENYLATED PLANT PROTEIN 7 n=1 Tax=Salix viminalis TaxID=40686 RepID=A0A9Q0SGR6_SALVM|nr:HEAVY METAL-ASSOCIATED ISOPRENYLATED PLANT PROTEIN 7 [Salix viminalis]